MGGWRSSPPPCFVPRMPHVPFWSSLGAHALIGIQFGVAATATLLLAYRAWAERQPGTSASRRLRDTALICLAVVAFGCWWNLGRFHFPGYWHRHEFFHYFLGAKYNSELGYTRLYDCVAVAEVEDDPRPELLKRWTRDLRTNIVVAGAPATRDTSICRPHFSDARWAAFKQDVFWFRDKVSPQKWAQMQRDHGYNATPAWTTVGHLLSNTGPASNTRILALSLIDPVLLLIMWATVWWAFGWRTLAVAVIWWGTNYPARFNYIGGAFLREDWLALAVISIALAKRARMLPAGIAFGCSTLLRVFPGFAAGGLLLRSLRNPLSPEGRRQMRPTLQFVMGTAVAAALVVPASGLFLGGSLTGGVDVWSAFVANSRKHLSGASTNRVGLKAAMSYEPGSKYSEVGSYWLDNPGDTWQAARQRVFAERRVYYWLVAAAFLALLTKAVQGQPEWVALVLGIGLIPIFTDVTCYYYGILLAYGFLWPRKPSVGIALCALAAYSCLMPALLPSDEDRYVAISVGVVVFTFAVTAAMAWTGDKVPQQAAALSTAAG
jgi:hypothetical protein